ncbi:hypothetical protein NQ318_018914 [Aromia moschata]|uniref:Uncharacterized protein n=1 Tax=Aromia moschata TaxID=1265417 RepID=A0AAV8ZGI8_9CUCU|nr:hypothetical protein NQ318_018914 [Aromia moschata]
MLLPARCERVATSLHRTPSGDTLPTLSSLDKPVEGRETTKDDPLSGRPSTSKKDGNIEKIGKLIREDRRLSIRGVAEITGIDKECVRQILHESFNMRKVCAKVVPKLLTPVQKESRMNICADIINNIDTDPGLLDTVITCDDKIRKCGSGYSKSDGGSEPADRSELPALPSTREKSYGAV